MHAIAPLPRRAVARRAAGLRAWLRQDQLDEALADGADPWTSGELMIRAAELTSPTTRHKLASSIDALVALAEQGPPVSRLVSIRRSAVLAERDTLAALATRLRAPAPVSVTCVALLARLLWQGAGPLYDHAGGDDAIHHEFARCFERLEPALPARS
jgi:hypothetical protein